MIYGKNIISLIWFLNFCLIFQGANHPELLGGEYTHLDFLRRPLTKDLGKRVAYRDHYMTGWSYKTLTQDDLKYPLVCGEGKRVCSNFLFYFQFIVAGENFLVLEKLKRIMKYVNNTFKS